MANVYATKSGLWSDTTVWNTGALPATVDDVYTNTFTVTANTNTKVANIRNSSAAGITAGGSFVLANGVSLSANTLALLTVLPSTTATLVGNVEGSSQRIINNGNLTINGYLSGTATWSLAGGFACNTSSGTLNINGNVIGTSKSGVMINNTGGSVNITGDCFFIPSQASVTGVTGGLINAWGMTVVCNITGNVSSSFVLPGNAQAGNTVNIVGGVALDGSQACIGSVNGSGTVTVQGGRNITANNATSVIRATTVTLISCENIVNAPNGRQAIYAPKVFVLPSSSATYTRHASNGYDSYVDYWTPNSTFTYPASSDVALGTTYSNGTLSGSMAVPSPSSVALGALVGTSTGTASITFDNVLSQPIANLTTPNSIGARLKNITTSQALSSIVGSLEF